MTMDVEQERLWSLLTELSKQLTLNRETCAHLQKQAADLKTQAIHNGTGFILRRFNLDINQETFESELERLNATLVLENQSLQQENKQLSMLLKDYEGTLETVMARFRTFAHTTQQHDLHLSKHYEALLEQVAAPSQAISHEIPILQDQTAVEASLDRLAINLRKALRSLQGDDPSPPDSPPFPPSSSLSQEHEHLGGYLTLLGKFGTHQASDIIDNDYLERDAEMERLRQENESLRQLLSIATPAD